MLEVHRQLPNTASLEGFNATMTSSQQSQALAGTSRAPVPDMDDDDGDQTPEPMRVSSAATPTGSGPSPMHRALNPTLRIIPAATSIDDVIDNAVRPEPWDVSGLFPDSLISHFMNSMSLRPPSADTSFRVP